MKLKLNEMNYKALDGKGKKQEAPPQGQTKAAR